MGATPAQAPTRRQTLSAPIHLLSLSLLRSSVRGVPHQQGFRPFRTPPPACSLSSLRDFGGTFADSRKTFSSSTTSLPLQPRRTCFYLFLLKFRMFQTLHFQQRIKRIILIYHAARRCISLMPQAATNEIEWLHSAFVFIRCTFRCIVHCINSSYSKYSLLKKASSETSMFLLVFFCFFQSDIQSLYTSAEGVILTPN